MVLRAGKGDADVLHLVCVVEFERIDLGPLVAVFAIRRHVRRRVSLYSQPHREPGRVPPGDAVIEEPVTVLVYLQLSNGVVDRYRSVPRTFAGLREVVPHNEIGRGEPVHLLHVVDSGDCRSFRWQRIVQINRRILVGIAKRNSVPFDD